MFILSQWHGFKQMACLLWSKLYTPLYSFFYQKLYPQGNMLRTPRLVVLMQINNALAKMMYRRTNRDDLQSALEKYPHNPRLQCLHEFLTIALPRCLQ